MDTEQLEEAVELLEDKPAFILWYSGIEEDITLPEIREKWEIGNSNILSKPINRNDPDSPIYREKLEELGLIEVEHGRRNRFTIKSHTGWLANLFLQQPSQNRYNLSPNTYFTELDEERIRDFFESDAFRKGFMGLDELLGRLKEVQEGRKDVDKVWKLDFYWVSILLEALDNAQYYRAIQKYGEPAKNVYENSDGLLDDRIPDIDPTPLSGINMHPDKYDVPAIVKPQFEKEDLVDYFSSSLKTFKKHWPELWQEIKEEVESSDP